MPEENRADSLGNPKRRTEVPGRDWMLGSVPESKRRTKPRDQSYLQRRFPRSCAVRVRGKKVSTRRARCRSPPSCVRIRVRKPRPHRRTSSVREAREARYTCGVVAGCGLYLCAETARWASQLTDAVCRKLSEYVATCNEDVVRFATRKALLLRAIRQCVSVDEQIRMTAANREKALGKLPIVLGDEVMSDGDDSDPLGRTEATVIAKGEGLTCKRANGLIANKEMKAEQRASF